MDTTDTAMMPVEKKRPLTILITRPEAQAKALCDDIRARGWDPILFPTIYIEPLSPSTSRVHCATPPHIAIFLSANAVLHSPHRWHTLHPTMKCIAIGSGTAEALYASGYHAVTVPTTQSSEGLMELDILQQAENKTIYLYSGENSRPWLAEQLSKKNHVVSVLCYRRIPATLTTEHLDILHHRPIDYSITTSMEIVSNFHRLITEAKAYGLLNTPLIVIHEKHANLAYQLGFHSIIIATNAQPISIIKALDRAEVML